VIHELGVWTLHARQRRIDNSPTTRANERRPGIDQVQHLRDGGDLVGVLVLVARRDLPSMCSKPQSLTVTSEVIQFSSHFSKASEPSRPKSVFECLGGGPPTTLEPPYNRRAASATKHAPNMRRWRAEDAFALGYMFFP
jgi:hypothetical protein